MAINSKLQKSVLCNGYEFKLLFKDLFKESGQVISKLQMMRTAPVKNIALAGNILTGLTIRRYESFEEYCPSFKTTPLPAHYEELKSYGIHLLFKVAPDGSVIIGDSHEYASATNFDELGFNLNSHIIIDVSRSQQDCKFRCASASYYMGWFLSSTS